MALMTLNMGSHTVVLVQPRRGQSKHMTNSQHIFGFDQQHIFGFDKCNDLLEAFKYAFGVARLTSKVSMASTWLDMSMSSAGLESVVLGNYS
jgi:hypothetical protein